MARQKIENARYYTNLSAVSRAMHGLIEQGFNYFHRGVDRRLRKPFVLCYKRVRGDNITVEQL